MASIDGALYECRICLDTGPRRDLISPCACKGSSKWVHRACIDQWRAIGGPNGDRNKSFSKCPTCLQSYVLISLTNDTEEEQRQRKMRYYHRVSVDILTALGVFLLVVIVVGVFIWFCDSKKRLMMLFPYFKSPFAFYFLSGLTLLLSIIGILFFIAMITSGSRTSPTFYWYDWYFCSNAAAETRCCANCCFCCTNGSDAALGASRVGSAEGCCSCATCGECGTCSGCTCDGCAGAGASSDALPAVMVCILIFAALGLLVSVFAGIVMINNVLAKHMDVIERIGYTQEYVVADLEPMAEDLELGSMNSSSSFGPSAINPMVGRYGTDNNGGNNSSSGGRGNFDDHARSDNSKGVVELMLLGSRNTKSKTASGYEPLTNGDESEFLGGDFSPFALQNNVSSTNYNNNCNYNYNNINNSIENDSKLISTDHNSEDFMPSAPILTTVPDSFHLNRCNNPSAPTMNVDQERRLKAMGYI